MKVSLKKLFQSNDSKIIQNVKPVERTVSYCAIIDIYLSLLNKSKYPQSVVVYTMFMTRCASKFSTFPKLANISNIRIAMPC